MSKFKKGDKVRSKESTPNGITEGTVYVLIEDQVGNIIEFYDNEGDGRTRQASKYELVPEKPKGTFETLVIESHPQGGYSVIAPGRHWGSEKTTLAAFTTVDEATKFIGENIK